MNDSIRLAVSKQNLETVGNIRKLSLNLVEKWRKIREAENYAKKFQLRPRLIARY